MTIDLEPSRTHIQQIITQHGGYLPVQAVQEILSDYDATIDQFLLALMLLASEAAVMPISHFKVGSVVVGATGNLYVGANQEYLHVPLNQAVHAEQAAIAMAHLHGETSIVKLAASAKPCGHCRQFLNELSEASDLDVLLPEGEVVKLTKLLPHAFGPKELDIEAGLLSSAPQDFKIKDTDELVQQALHAMNKSYAPYSNAYSGVALQAKDGRIFRGSYLENAVFNPSLPALQAAFVHLIQSQLQFSDITDAVLLQAKNGGVNHAGAAELLLKAACPAVKLRVYNI